MEPIWGVNPPTTLQKLQHSSIMIQPAIVSEKLPLEKCKVSKIPDLSYPQKKISSFQLLATVDCKEYAHFS